MDGGMVGWKKYQVETREKWEGRKGIQCEMAKINTLGNLREMKN